MASNQVIKYAPQCGDLIVESLNCPLAEAFTKSPLVVYQSLIREFWCTAIASHPNLPTDDSEVRPLKEYLIKFLVMNGKKPLTLHFKTFTESTRLNYAKGKYVSHPYTKEVKPELAKIVDNPILLDRTPILKTAFPVAWRILFTIVVQVLGGNYSSTEQVNSIQQLFGYCLLTGTKVDIGEIIYSDLVTRLTNKYRTDAKYQADQTQSARLRYRSLTENEGKTSSEVELDSETLQLKTFADVQALRLSDDEMV
ncbi:hypothetical protein Tco_0664984 [Tanacetum coccineum]